MESEGDVDRVFSITLLRDVASPSATVPPEFLVPDTEYKFEVIVQEESGNRTISETEFTTAPQGTVCSTAAGSTVLPGASVRRHAGSRRVGADGAPGRQSFRA